MQLPYIAVLDRVEYVWNGRAWFGKADYMKPPIATLSRLNALVESELEKEDEKLLNPFDSLKIIETVTLAKGCGQRKRMESLLRKAYERSGFKDGAIAAMLSSYLREVNRFNDALDVAAKYQGKANSALLTSKAAALCDVGRYEDALKQIKIVLAMANGIPREALGVHARIKKESEILFQWESRSSKKEDVGSKSHVCPKCGGALVEKQNQKTQEYFTGCSRYPDCGYSERIGFGERSNSRGNGVYRDKSVPDIAENWDGERNE